jgi:DNA replication protein DnaC
MNAMSLKFDIQQSTQICSTHNEQMVSYRGRVFCKTCSLASVNQGNKDHAVAVNEMVREKHFAGAKLPNRHANSGFKEYQTHNDGQYKAKSGCVTFARDVLEGVVRNLIMVGRTGTGKTHLSCAVARNVLDKGKYARYITSEDMANDIASTWKRADDSEESAVYRYTEYDLLILDEYGLHDRHENRLQLVHKVLYSRYDEGKSTMLISNMTLNELKMDLGDRLWSRFQHDGLTVIECNWADQRVGGGV